MKQRYHTIIRPHGQGMFIGWVEELPGALSAGRSVKECRQKLREAVELLVTTHRDEAQRGINPSCIRGSIMISLMDHAGTSAQYA